MGNYNSTTIGGSSVIITSTTTTTTDRSNRNVNEILTNTAAINDNFNSNQILIDSFTSSSQNPSSGLLVNASANVTKFSDILLSRNNITNISSSIYNNINDNYNNTSSNGLLKKVTEKLGRGLSSSEVNMIRNQVTLSGGIISNSNTNNGGYNYQSQEDLLKQMEYDKFMNEIWIGIVLTLIVISLVFCICSCFLYHQFRQWKRNYRQNIQRNYDIESVKLNLEDDDPVPNYTLVSGLPSYEAALELLRNSSSSSTTLLLPTTPVPPYPSPPSVFHVFSSLASASSANEKEESANSCQKLQSSSSSVSLSQSTTTTTTETSKNQQEQQQQQHMEQELNPIPSYEEAIKNDSSSQTTQIISASVSDEKFVSSGSDSNSNNCNEAILDTKLLST